MSANLGKIVGHQYDDLPLSWNKRDLLLYAVGIGATKDDLDFVYELNKKFAAFPTYPVVLPMKLNKTDVINFRELYTGQDNFVEGLSAFNPDRVVHGSQFIEVLKPLPLTGEGGWKLKRRIVGIHENKSGIIVDQEHLIVSPSGEIYARMFMSLFNVGARVLGRSFSKVIAGAPVAKTIHKNRKPSYVFTQTVPENQAAIYRLSGDYNALHIEPTIGIKAGFGGVILQGLCTFGFVARGILSTVGDNDPNSLKAYGCRFSSPVKPGDKLETSVWELGEGPDGTIELGFSTKNLNSQKISLSAGIAFVKKTEKSKL